MTPTHCHRLGLVAIALLMTSCASSQKLYEQGEYQRVQNCKAQFSPNDPQYDYCIENARRPFEDVEDNFSEKPQAP